MAHLELNQYCMCSKNSWFVKMLKNHYVSLLFANLSNNCFDRYALGGYDECDMSPSIEIFDRRRGKWLNRESINHSSGD